ncbi:MAG: Mobile element protein, partial [uncultured Gemmatimonadetes bacterium]
WAASGELSACSLTAARRSSSPPIRSSSRRCATSSASTSILPLARWCCAWTRSRGSRRPREPLGSCRCGLASRSAGRTAMCARGHGTCSRRWTRRA